MKSVYRTIVHKNERQENGVYDVLICQHVVRVDADARANTYRKARACPVCSAQVERFRKAGRVK